MKTINKLLVLLLCIFIFNPLLKADNINEDLVIQKNQQLINNAKQAVENAELLFTREQIDNAYKLVNELDESVQKTDYICRLRLLDYKLDNEGSNVVCDECKESNVWMFICMGLMSLLIFESIFIIVKSKNY